MIMHTLTRIGRENAGYFNAFLPGIEEISTDETNLCIGDLLDGEPAGVLVGTLTNEIGCIRDLYVSERQRRKGVGSALLQGFIDAADHMGALAYYTDFPASEDAFYNMGAEPFYTQNAFLVMDGDEFLSVPIVSLHSSARVKRVMKGYEMPPYLSRFMDLSAAEKNTVFRFLGEEGYDPADLFELDYDERISCVIRDRSGQIETVLLAGFADDEILVYYLCNRGGMSEVLDVLSHLFDLANDLPGIERISFLADTKSVEELAFSMASSPEDVTRSVRSRHAVFAFVNDLEAPRQVQA